MGERERESERETEREQRPEGVARVSYCVCVRILYKYINYINTLYNLKKYIVTYIIIYYI